MKPALFLAVCGVVCAQPRVVNGTVAAGQGTAAAFVAAHSEAAWFGFPVPAVAGAGRSCCWYNDYNGCLLEPRDTPPNGTPKASPIALESPKTVNVLVRVENKHAVRVRNFAPDCELDAGGLTITWLPDVKAADGLRYLESLLKDTSLDTARERERLRGGALEAISLNADSAAEATLEKIAADATDPLRRQALNGLARRPEGFTFLSTMAKNGGEVLLILADRAGVKAIPVIQSAMEKDPQKAVQALARLPKEEGVPLLIQAAKNESNPTARKEAVRQLSRIKDPRASDYFESVLK